MHKRCLDLTNLLSEILLMKMQVLAVASRKSVKAFVLKGNLVQCLKKNKGCWKLLDICSVCVNTVVNIHYSLQSDSFCKQLCEIIICTTCTIVVH